MNKNQKINLQIGAIAIAICSLAFGIGYSIGIYTKSDDIIIVAPEPVIVEPDPPIVIEVDGIGCVIAEVPVLTYYVSTDTVRVNIECSGELLNHYLPAIDNNSPIVDNSIAK